MMEVHKVKRKLKILKHLDDRPEVALHKTPKVEYNESLKAKSRLGLFKENEAGDINSKAHSFAQSKSPTPSYFLRRPTRPRKHLDTDLGKVKLNISSK